MLSPCTWVTPWVPLCAPGEKATSPARSGIIVAYALFVAVCTYLVYRLIAYTVEAGLTWLFPPALGPVLTAVGMAGLGVINYVRLRRTRKV